MSMPRAALLAVLASLLPAAVAHGAAGDLDQRFGDGGTQLVAVGPADAEAAGVALAPDGALLVAGAATDGDAPGGPAQRLLLQRFGPFGGPAAWTFMFPRQEPPTDTVANGLDVLPDGRVAVAGSVLLSTEGRQSGLVTLHRPDGALDPAFGGGDGILAPGFADDRAAGIAHSDGRLLVAGAAVEAGTTHGELVRLLPDGAGDPSFGAGGVAPRTAGEGDYERYEAVAATPDGGAAVAGLAETAGGGQGLLIARFSDRGGLLRTTIAGFPSGVAVGRAIVALPDGSIVAGGETGSGSDADWALVKQGADGRLDDGFGAGGKVVAPLGRSEDRLLALAAAPDGRLVAAGFTSSEDGERSFFTIARFTAGGRLDTAFGNDGVVRVPLPGDSAAARGVAVLRDGSVIAAGRAQQGGRSVVALARLLGDGPVPPLATSDGGAGEPVPIGAPSRGRFSIRLVSRRVERGGTLRVRVRWPRGWRGAARIEITRVRTPRLLLASRPVRGRGGTGRVVRVKLTRLGRDALLGVKRTRVRLALLPDPAALGG